MVARVEKWDVNLTRYLNACRKRARVYGDSDCVMYAAGAVEAQTGEDFAAEHRGKYSDLDGARAYMAAHGWDDVDAVCDAYLERVDVRARRRGDILAFEGVAGKSLGVCIGQHAMVLTPEGATYYPSSRAFAAWRVGDA